MGAPFDLADYLWPDLAQGRQPHAHVGVAQDLLVFAPKTVVNFAQARAVLSGTTVPLDLGGTRIATPHGIAVSGFTGPSLTPIGEICHPPQTQIALVYVQALPASGTNDVVGFAGNGDSAKFACSPYSWTWAFQRNYTGPLISVASAGSSSQPVVGKLFFLVARSESNTSHKFEVWRLDNGGYESGTATTDTSAVSFVDAMPFKAGILGYGVPLLFGIFDEFIPDSVLNNLVASPWDLFAASARRIWFDMGAAQSLVTGANSTQANAASSAAIRQTHLTLTANGVQANVASAAAIAQTHRVAGAASSQPNVATAGSVSQATTTFVAGSHCTQPNTAAAGAILQTHRVAGAAASQPSMAAAGAVAQTHRVAAANSAQANVATVGSVSQDGTTYVAGSHSAQANAASAGAIRQTHRVVAAPAVADAVAAASSIVQTHLVSAANCVQGNAASAGFVIDAGASSQAEILMAGRRDCVLYAQQRKCILRARTR